MIETDDRLRLALDRLARSLVPDDTPDDIERLMHRVSSKEKPGANRAIVQIGARRQRRGVLAAAAALLLAGAGGAGLAIGANHRAPSAPTGSASPGADPSAPERAPWTDGVEMIVYVRPGTSQTDLDAIRSALVAASDVVDISRLVYLDAQQSLAEAAVVLANDPGGLALLDVTNVPTSFKVVPQPGRSGDLRTLADQIRDLPGVNTIQFADDLPSSRDTDPSGTAEPTVVPSSSDPEQPKTSAVRISNDIVAFGDSVMQAAGPSLLSAGVTVHAIESIQGQGMIDLVRSTLAGTDIINAVVIEVGTNGPVTQLQYDQLADLVADVPHAFFLTVKAPKDWITANNALITSLPARHPNVTVIDWATLAEQIAAELSPGDGGIHLQTERAVAFYTNMIVTAISADTDADPNAGSGECTAMSPVVRDDVVIGVTPSGSTLCAGHDVIYDDNGAVIGLIRSDGPTLVSDPEGSALSSSSIQATFDGLPRVTFIDGDFSVRLDTFGDSALIVDKRTSLVPGLSEVCVRLSDPSGSEGAICADSASVRYMSGETMATGTAVGTVMFAAATGTTIEIMDGTSSGCDLHAYTPADIGNITVWACQAAIGTNLPIRITPANGQATEFILPLIRGSGG